jgi:hypothetical protein
MRSLRMAVLLLAMFLVSVTSGLFAEEVKKTEEAQKAPEVKPAEQAPAVTGSASMAVLNRYIFRGYEIGKSGLVVQPSLTASYKGFSATFLGNIDSDQRNTTTATFADREAGKKGFNETDLTVSYTYVVRKFSLTGGYIYYNLKYAEDTEEFFLTFAYDMPGKPILSLYQDVNAYPGTYANLSFSHSIPVYKDATLDLGASFGYEFGQGGFWRTYEPVTGGYTGGKYKGFHDGMVKAGFTIPVTKAFSVQPIVQYYFPLSGDANRNVGTDPATGLRIPFNHNGYVPYSLVGGVNFSYSF